MKILIAAALLLVLVSVSSIPNSYAATFECPDTNSFVDSIETMGAGLVVSIVCAFVDFTDVNNLIGNNTASIQTLNSTQINFTNQQLINNTGQQLEINSLNATVTSNEEFITEFTDTLLLLRDIIDGKALLIVDTVPYKDDDDTRAVLYSILPTVPREGEVRIFIFMPNGTLDSTGPGNEPSTDFLINNPVDGIWNATIIDNINNLTDTKLFEIIDANLPEGSPED